MNNKKEAIKKIINDVEVKITETKVLPSGLTVDKGINRFWVDGYESGTKQFADYLEIKKVDALCRIADAEEKKIKIEEQKQKTETEKEAEEQMEGDFNWMSGV